MAIKSKVLFSVESDSFNIRIISEVNGTSLIDLVGAFECEHSFDVPGAYGGLIFPWQYRRNVARYFRGRIRLFKIALLDCTCSVSGCWPLHCHICVSDDEVSWERFSQPFRPKQDYSGFGPFVFEARQYWEAVARLQADFSAKYAAEVIAYKRHL